MPLCSKPLRLNVWQRRAIKGAVHGWALGYLMWLFFAGITDTLGPDPVNTLLNQTGIWAIHLLLITLTLSPLAKALPSPAPIQFRRLVGVYSFVYAFAHLFTYITFELQLDMALVMNELLSRPYIVVGMVAFLLLLALSVTSFKAIQVRMGQRWQQLHNSVYLILILVLVHFSWSQKTIWQEPIWYWLVGLLLLIPRIKHKVSRIKRAHRAKE
ncbi:protein-methionine-sulfoxide reductase heme-binding subunit MsrQ [Alteromonas sp. D210916BOD_24]|uniref:sulfite oxidase heme-binding subunit YedZ n=1 Tax=Alteromonas sp. D210916BOD_24 TaxID=3157618 RepID=UPI00399CF9E0